MYGIRKFDLEIQPIDLPDNMVTMHQEVHRTRCMPKGYYLLQRDEENKKTYGVDGKLDVGEVRSNYYPYGVSDNKYPYDKNGVEIRGVRFLLVIPERDRLYHWIHTHKDYRIIIRYLRGTKNYFPDLSDDDVFEIVTSFIQKHMEDYEFIVHPVTINKAKRALNEFNFSLNADEMMALKIMIQSERIHDFRQKEQERGQPMEHLTKDLEVMSRMLTRYDEMQSGVKTSRAKIQQIKWKQAQLELDQKMLKNQEDDGISQREMLEESENRIISGLSHIPENIKDVLKDQGSRRKILNMIGIMKSKDSIEIVDDKDVSSVQSNKIVLKTQEVTYTEQVEQSVKKDDENDDIIVI